MNNEPGAGTGTDCPARPGPAWPGLGPFNVHTFHICAVHISFSMTLTGQCGKRAVCDEPCRVLHQQQQRRVCAHPQCIKESACVCAYVCVCQLICMLQLCVCVRLPAACLQWFQLMKLAFYVRLGRDMLHAALFIANNSRDTNCWTAAFSLPRPLPPFAPLVRVH